MEKRYSTLKKENRNQDIYYELTPCGAVFCAIAGLAAELLVLLGFRIQFEHVPVPVFGFLWLLFGILISGMLIGLEMLMGLAVGRNYRTASGMKRQAEPVFGCSETAVKEAARAKQYEFASACHGYHAAGQFDRRKAS